MQWLQFFFWGSMTLWASRNTRRARIWGHVLCAALLLSMGTQLWLLGEIGQLTVNTAVPLHLCSVMAILSIPMLWFRSKGLYALSLLFGAPCALLALCFPAIADCARPGLMASAFYRLHVLIFWAPFLLRWQGFPLPANPRPAMLGAIGYMAFVSLFNLIFNTNYLFLRLAPAQTPLMWLEAQGTLGYVLSLVMTAMVVLSALSWVYGKLPALKTAEPRHR